jgi:hypothetical protein
MTAKVLTDMNHPDRLSLADETVNERDRCNGYKAFNVPEINATLRLWYSSGEGKFSLAKGGVIISDMVDSKIFRFVLLYSRCETFR